MLATSFDEFTIRFYIKPISDNPYPDGASIIHFTKDGTANSAIPHIMMNTGGRRLAACMDQVNGSPNLCATFPRDLPLDAFTKVEVQLISDTFRVYYDDVEIAFYPVFANHPPAYQNVTVCMGSALATNHSAQDFYSNHTFDYGWIHSVEYRK